MSGGSWGYFFGRIYDVAEALCGGYSTDDGDSRLRDLTPEQMESRRQFGLLLKEVAEVMRNIEWVDSGDTSTPSDVNAIEKLFAKLKESGKLSDG